MPPATPHESDGALRRQPASPTKVGTGTVIVRSIVPSLFRSMAMVAVPLATVTSMMALARVMVHAPAVGLPSAA